MATRIALVVVLTALVGPGCAPKIGRDFNTSYVSGIERGITTKAEVRQNLGEPHSVTTTSGGEIWSYRYMQGSNYAQDVGALFGTREYKGMSQKMLTITFAGDRVKDFMYREGK
jgi:outer membrane protein assembly factor BamE (lipoprotein component of BamABCDE complex)